MSAYNPWPIGQLREEWQRPELLWAKNHGLYKADARELVALFESTIASYCGSTYAVAVDCCSHGIFLALKYLCKINPELQSMPQSIPSQTYASVPMQMIHAGWIPKFNPTPWSGVYQIGNTGIFDSAGRFTQNMYVETKGIQILSFQIKKILPIGRGGMILTDDFEAYSWFLKARHDGRDLSSPYDSPDHIGEIGWHFYMTPEDAARGLKIFSDLPAENADCMNYTMYPDLQQWKIWQ